MPTTDADRTMAERARQLERLDRLSQTFGQSLSEAFEQNLDAARQLDGLLGTLGSKLSSVAVTAAMTPLRGGVESLVKGVLNARYGEGSLGLFARGGVVSPVRDGGADSGPVRPFAGGGVVAAPTYFPMHGGTGLMGEAGPEAILPLRRGSDGRLGVAAGGERPVSVTVNVTTPDAESFRRSEAQVAASLARVGAGEAGFVTTFPVNRFGSSHSLSPHAGRGNARAPRASSGDRMSRHVRD